jgi:hypothetical protein
MPIDINLFREDQGGMPGLVIESQRRRFVVEPSKQVLGFISLTQERRKGSKLCSDDTIMIH